MTSTPPADEALLPRVARGDKAAVRACIARYGGLVWSLARRFLRDPREAEDAVQEVFVDLWRSADRFDPEVSSEVVFVSMITRRRLIDRRRRTQRRLDTEPMPASEPEGHELHPERSAEAKNAARALEQLRPEQRQVLLMSACEGLSHDEIAKLTGMPLGTVKAHARRGLIKVRELLQGGSS